MIFRTNANAQIPPITISDFLTKFFIVCFLSLTINLVNYASKSAKTKAHVESFSLSRSYLSLKISSKTLFEPSMYSRPFFVPTSHPIMDRIATVQIVENTFQTILKIFISIPFVVCFLLTIRCVKTAAPKSAKTKAHVEL